MTFPKITLLITLALLFSVPTNAQSVGEKAPRVLFRECLNHPRLNPDFFKGKYLVLDFWATWCGPCIASFPHLDSLSKRYSSDNVIFAIISSEKKEKINKFLGKRNINAYHLLDSITTDSKKRTIINDLYGITAQNFGVKAIPHTVIIDQENNIVWKGIASALTESDLADIINGNSKEVMKKNNALESKELFESQKRAEIFASTKKDSIKGDNYLFVTAKLPYESPNMSAGSCKGKYVWFVQIDSHSLDWCYNYFTRTPVTRIHNTMKDYSIFVRYESGEDYTQEYGGTLLDLISKVHRVNFVKQKREVNTLDLTIVDQTKFKKKSKPFDAKSGHSSSQLNEHELVYTNFIFEDIARGLENHLKIPIILTNEDDRKILCDMNIKALKLPELTKVLLNEYGLQLRPGKHAVEFIDIVPMIN